MQENNENGERKLSYLSSKIRNHLNLSHLSEQNDEVDSWMHMSQKKDCSKKISTPKVMQLERLESM